MIDYTYNLHIFIIYKFIGMTKLELPTQFDNFTAMAEQFREYKEDHYVYITTLFICTYLYKQTFAIPGSFLLVI